MDDHVLIFDPKDPDVSRAFEQRGFLPPGAKRYKDQRYTFDRVFDEHARQIDVFENTTKPLLDGLLDGFNATVFAYGVSLDFALPPCTYIVTNRTDSISIIRPQDAGKRTRSAAQKKTRVLSTLPWRIFLQRSKRRKMKCSLKFHSTFSKSTTRKFETSWWTAQYHSLEEDFR